MLFLVNLPYNSQLGIIRFMTSQSMIIVFTQRTQLSPRHSALLQLSTVMIYLIKWLSIYPLSNHGTVVLLDTMFIYQTGGYQHHVCWAKNVDLSHKWTGLIENMLADIQAQQPHVDWHSTFMPWLHYERLKQLINRHSDILIFIRNY